MDKEIVAWAAEFIQNATKQVEGGPCVIFEAEGNKQCWLQVLPESTKAPTNEINGFILNFPYKDNYGDPLKTLEENGRKAPPESKTMIWEDNAFATVWIRPDIPPGALVLFIEDIFTLIMNVSDGFEFSIKLEFGY